MQTYKIKRYLSQLGTADVSVPQVLGQEGVVGTTANGMPLYVVLI